MIINGKKVEIGEVIKFANYDGSLLKRRENGMLLSDYQIAVLKRNGMNYEKYGNIRELLFDIEDILKDEYDDELDLIGSQLSELIYYGDTKK